ncbi:hypothetical protein [Planctomicrobium piriforme]|uniref:Uncharacterized protein n=1 Tax=Planctomicrobium piriforme TaxID=1576369 RepID=A0A1I3C6F7_9PLAN|nr:hypothetical protein [Planctomicrobium piriforme]SFH70165.1 hypothetical protein SAMN05421753_102139 [Planctomicrobium piriforme]
MPAQPQWLSEFVEGVCGCLHAVEELPPIGCHYIHADQTWEVSIFISPTELVGGEHDGERLSCLYVVDVVDLMHVFDVVESASWQPLALNETDELKSHLAVSGYFQGNSIWLRILAETPERYDPGRFIDLNSGRIVDTWNS